MEFKSLVVTLRDAPGGLAVGIDHVGSTSVPGLGSLQPTAGAERAGPLGLRADQGPPRKS
ncbi:hypothetical protein ACWF9B_05165 [Streptomyces sp. NPDC055089]